jgi:hypothetical protein
LRFWVHLAFHSHPILQNVRLTALSPVNAHFLSPTRSGPEACFPCSKTWLSPLYPLDCDSSLDSSCSLASGMFCEALPFLARTLVPASLESGGQRCGWCRSWITLGGGRLAYYWQTRKVSE